MSSLIQFFIDHGVPCQGVPDSLSIFLILRESRCGEVVDDQVHPSSDLLRAKYLFVMLDARLVKTFHRDRD